MKKRSFMTNYPSTIEDIIESRKNNNCLCLQEMLFSLVLIVNPLGRALWVKINNKASVINQSIELSFLEELNLITLFFKNSIDSSIISLS